MNIVYEDEQLIAVVKPAGTPSQPDKTGDADMYGAVCAHADPVWLVHRLDRPVGGLLLFAKNERVCRALSADMAEGRCQKSYAVVVCGEAEAEASLEHDLVKNARLNVSKVARPNEKGAKRAVLRYSRLETVRDDAAGSLSLLDVALITGRHHQIRVQLAHAGLPVWGDTKYNAAFARLNEFVRIALWARRLSFKHPASGRTLDLCVCPPKEQFPFSDFTY